MERIPIQASRTSTSLRGAGEPAAGLAYLFAVAGSARLTGESFQPVDIPSRGIACIPASAPPFEVEDMGGLDLIRISPRWPATAA